MDSGLVKQFNEINEKNERLKEENEKQKIEFVKYRQTVETKHEEYNEYIDKLKEVINKLKENCDRLNKETEHYRNKFTSYQREIEPRYKEEVKKLRQEKELYQNELTKYQQVIIPKYNENINNLKKEFSIVYEKSSTEVTKLQQSNTPSSYQSALRSAESSCYNLRDGDRNDPVQLTNDLRSLQERIERYVTTLKGAVVVDNEKVLELFKKYNLKIENQTTQDKLLMKSVLQRYVLEKVLEYADEYLNNINDPCNQEKQIMNHADGLLNILGKFHRNHLIKDNKNKFTTARKIHEQVYGLLGEHGFSDIYDENNDSSNSSNGDDNKQLQSTKHPFVSSAVQKLNALMTEYRLIKDVNKRRYTENMAENIIKDIVRIFRFRLLINEPRFELYWFKRNEKIKPDLMRGTWDDDCLEDYVVDICFFPLIGTNLKDNNKNNDLDCKILTYAKVYSRSIINSHGEESLEVDEKKASSENNNNNGIIANMLKKVIGRHESTDQQNGENQDGNNSISSSVPQDKKAKIPTKNNDGNDNPSLSNNNVNSSKSNDLKNNHQEKKGSNQENEDSDSDSDDNYKDLDYDKIDRDESY
ncbi:7166_t:CDS:2 [Entrophospora sp. SA101]|nr:7166_t:CDS:2 [Entrophospora sp. SA101]CAJ0919750.1 11169_t:CDS:2 [Entrophospora sp. SA101]CAJ0919768.1 256_t:CDS:2 [Entrophospora sp. SA101]